MKKKIFGTNEFGEAVLLAIVDCEDGRRELDSKIPVFKSPDQQMEQGGEAIDNKNSTKNGTDDQTKDKKKTILTYLSSLNTLEEEAAKLADVQTELAHEPQTKLANKRGKEGEEEKSE